MKYYLFVALLTMMSAPQAQQATPDKDTLRQAFDGAMTCSALAAITADKVAANERWLWENRSFAFGKLAAQIWQQATDEPPTGEKMNEALNRYASTLIELPPEKVGAYETSCKGKHPNMDKLCEVHSCIHDGPPAVESPAPAAQP